MIAKLSQVTRNSEPGTNQALFTCAGHDLHKVTGFSDRDGCTAKRAVSPYCVLTRMKLGIRQFGIRCAVGTPNAVVLAWYGGRESSAYAYVASTVFKMQGAIFHFSGI